MEGAHDRCSSLCLCLGGKLKNRLKPREFMREKKERRQRDAEGRAGKKGKSRKRGGKGNTVCFVCPAAPSTHFSSPLYCLSKCLIVYYLIPVLSSSCGHWLNTFRKSIIVVYFLSKEHNVGFIHLFCIHTTYENRPCFMYFNLKTITTHYLLLT